MEVLSGAFLVRWKDDARACVLAGVARGGQWEGHSSLRKPRVRPVSLPVNDDWADSAPLTHTCLLTVTSSQSCSLLEGGGRVCASTSPQHTDTRGHKCEPDYASSLVAATTPAEMRT